MTTFLRHQRRFLILVAGSLFCIHAPMAQCGDRDSQWRARRGLVSHSRAEDWEEALISGNGTIGALVMGNPLDEAITFSHERLFMPWYPSQPVIDMAPHLSEIRHLVDEGKYRNAAEFVVGLAVDCGYDGMRWTDPLIPAFDLKITMPAAGDVRDYARSVDFRTGVVTISWVDDRGRWSRELFVSRPDQVAAMLLTCDRNGMVDCEVGLQTTAQEVDDREEVEEDEYEASFMQGVDNVEIKATGPTLTYKSRFTKSRADSIKGHQGAAIVFPSGGSLETTDQAVAVRDADSVLVLVAIEVDNQPDARTSEKLLQHLRSLGPEFDALLRRHAKVHGGIFDRTWFRLDGDKDSELPSEALLGESQLGQSRSTLLQKQFDAARYAILSSSGELPPTLQGVWTGTWTPPWQSDYTQNGNVPSAIASMMSTNMPECMLSYIGYMESLVPHFRENARRLYGCRGIMVPSRTSSHGYNTHFNEDFCHLFWTPGAAWSAQFFYDYYLYTGDLEFLRDRAFPFMTEAAMFYEDFLYEGPDGKLVFNPSYSPENTPTNSDSQACINATMDIALVKKLFRNLIQASEELDVDDDSVARWKSILERMPSYRINEDGTLAEWTTPKLRDNHAHRHVSHLVAAFDTLPDEIADSQSLQRAIAQVIEDRMGPRRQDGGGIMSFGLVHLGLAAANLGKADLAHEAVEMLSHAYWRDNLVSTHNPNEIFNVDISGGLPAVIVKMLVDSRVGRITLLPALPRQWPSGEIGGVLCRGQIELQQLEWDANQIDVSLVSGREQRIEIDVPGGIESISAEDAGVEIESGAPHGGYWVHLPQGRTVGLQIVREGGVGDE